MKLVIVVSLALTLGQTAAADACAKTLGQTPHDQDAECECGDDKVKIAKTKFCYVASDKKGNVADAKLDKKCGADAKCTEAHSTCAKAAAADTAVTVCLKDETCKGEDGTCTAAAAAAATTSAAPTTSKAAAAAATTAAASATTKASATVSASITPEAAEAAAKIAHAAALTVMKAVTEDAVKAALNVGKPTAVEAPTVKKFEAGKGATVTATITGDPNADASLKKTLDTYFCGLMKIPVDMCKATYTAAARVLADNERRLAGKKMDVAIAIKTEAEYAKEKKAAAAAAQKTLSSGATSFGVAAAMGLVAVLY